jgi:hypothetical protein
MEDSPRSARFAADFGGGQHADVEFPAANTLWLAAGPGIEAADIWMKGVAGVGDLRVRVLRLGTALEVSVDRGEQSTRWWTPEAAPRLLIAVDQAQGVASATASIGTAENAMTVDFGKMNY